MKLVTLSLIDPDPILCYNVRVAIRRAWGLPESFLQANTALAETAGAQSGEEEG